MGIPQMKADFSEHCVWKAASSHHARAVEGTSHLRLLTQRNAGSRRSYPPFLCHSNRALVVSCKNCSLFLGDCWLLWVESDGVSGVEVVLGDQPGTGPDLLASRKRGRGDTAPDLLGGEQLII